MVGWKTVSLKAFEVVWLMEWISWRASHERRGWAEAEAHRLQMSFSENPPLQEGRGLNQTRRWLCRPTMEKLPIHAVMKGFCLLSLQLGHRAWSEFRSQVYWQIMMKGVVSGASSRSPRPLWRSMEAVETPVAWFEVAAPFWGTTYIVWIFPSGSGHTEIRDSGMISTHLSCGPEILKISRSLLFSPLSCGFSVDFLHFLQMIQERIGHILLVYTTKCSSSFSFRSGSLQPSRSSWFSTSINQYR